MWKKQVTMMIGVVSGLMIPVISFNTSNFTGNASLYSPAHPFGSESLNSTFLNTTLGTPRIKSIQTQPADTDASNYLFYFNSTNRTLVEKLSEDQDENKAVEFFSALLYTADTSNFTGSISLYPLEHRFESESLNSTFLNTTLGTPRIELIETLPSDMDASDYLFYSISTDRTLVENSSEDQGENKAVDFLSAVLYTADQTEFSNNTVVNSSAIVDDIVVLPAYPGKNDTNSSFYTPAANISSITNTPVEFLPDITPENATERRMLRGSLQNV